MGVGLQTSVVIHEHFPPDQEDPRSRRRVLVRIVDASDPQTRDRIIRSTNSQTAVPTASLHAQTWSNADIIFASCKGRRASGLGGGQQRVNTSHR